MPGRTIRPYGHDQVFLWPRQFLSRGIARSTVKDAALYDAQSSDALEHPTTHNLLTLWNTHAPPDAQQAA